MAQSAQLTIDCGRFLLRPLEARDKQCLVRYANNRNIWRNVRDIFPFPYTAHDAVEFIDFCNQKRQINNFCIDIEGECTGMIGFLPQADVYRLSAEIGYWLGEPFWGKGIATAAVKALADHIFSTTDIVRLYAGVFEWNAASRKVLLKAGFHQEGLFEKAIFKDGQLINEYRFSLLKPGIH